MSLSTAFERYRFTRAGLGAADVREGRRLRAGDTWGLPDIRAALAEEREEVMVRIVEQGRDIKLQTHCSPRERRVLINGGLLAHIRQGGRLLNTGQVVSGAVDQGSPSTNPVEELPPTS